MADDGEDVRVAENKESSLGPFADSQGLTHDDLSNPVPGKLTTIKVGIVLEIYDNIPGSNAKDTAALLLRFVGERGMEERQANKRVCLKLNL